MDWMRGYFAHTGYNYGVYSETLPVRIRWAAMLNRHYLPESNFRYLDAGFGQGLSLVLAAAMHPESEFVGIDYMPEHVAHARRLADRCGLDNVTLIEGDFTDLAENPGELGEFDIVVCHGIATWIGPDIRRALYRMIGRTLRPGGVFYNAYNCEPGWLSVLPFQHMVKLEMRKHDGIDAIKAAQRKFEEIRQASELLFKAHPKLASRLEGINNYEASYLTQEYNHLHWRPAYVSEVIEELAAEKLNYLGAGWPSDCFDTLLPRGTRELLEAQTDRVMREQLRDFAMMQNFRRDLYIKGKPLTWDVERSERLRATRVSANPLMARPAAGEPFKIRGSANTMVGDHATYSALLDRIERLGDGATIGRLMDEEPDPEGKPRLVEALSLLFQMHWVSTEVPEPNPRGRDVTVAIAREVCNGAPYRYLPVPRTGGVIQLNEPDLIVTRLVGEGVAREAMPQELLANLNKLGRKLMKDGEAVTDPAALAAAATVIVDDFFVTKDVPFRNLGIL